mgnify:FL=1
MENLQGFLHPIQEQNKKIVVSKRFLDETGKPIEWEVRVLTAEEECAIRKSCMVNVPIVGKKGQYQRELDTNIYTNKIAAACTVYPNLSNAELQNAYGVMGEENLLRRMLTSGEYISYLEKIQDINGFNETLEDLVQEAKN